LIDIVIPEIGIVLFPAGRHLDKILLVGFVIPVAGGCRRAAVVFPLVPQHATDSVGQLGGLHACQQPAVDRVRILRLAFIPLVLVDAGATDGAVDHADGDFIVGHQTVGQGDPPITDAIGIAARR